MELAIESAQDKSEAEDTLDSGKEELDSLSNETNENPNTEEMEPPKDGEENNGENFEVVPIHDPPRKPLPPLPPGAPPPLRTIKSTTPLPISIDSRNMHILAEKEGTLWKQNLLTKGSLSRASSRLRGTRVGFKKRWCVVWLGTLYYWKSETSLEPEGRIKLRSCQVDLLNDRFYTFSIQTMERTVHMRGFDEQDSKEWIRFLQAKAKEVPSEPPDELPKKEIVNKHAGYLFKLSSGTLKTDWKQRWCVLRPNALYFYRSQESLVPEGVIWLRDCSGVAVTPLDQIYDNKKFPFNVVGPLRVHSFYAKTESDQNLWAKLILTAIQDFRSTERPETSDETSTEESLGEKSRRHTFAVPSLRKASGKLKRSASRLSTMFQPTDYTQPPSQPPKEPKGDYTLPPPKHSTSAPVTPNPPKSKSRASRSLTISEPSGFRRSLSFPLTTVDETTDVQLQRLMDERGIPEAERFAMKSLPAEVKMALIQQYVSKDSQNSSTVNSLKEEFEKAKANPDHVFDLSGQKLKSVPHFVHDRLPDLLGLDLSFNLIVQFPNLETFRALRILNISGNQLDVLPPSLSQLTALTELDATGNKISSLPEELHQMTQLERLTLANNSLTHLPSLEGLRALETLNLSGNPLELLPETIGECVSLETFNANFCQLSSLPINFVGLTRLVELELSNNRISELPWDLGRLTRLAVLNLSSNKLTDLPLSIGFCRGLNQIGNGINIRDNPIESKEMMERMDVGSDQLMDFLEKRMEESESAPRWEDLVPQVKEDPTPSEKKITAEELQEQEKKLSALTEWTLQNLGTLKSELLSLKTDLGSEPSEEHREKINQLHEEVNQMKPIQPNDDQEGTEPETKIHEMYRAFSHIEREIKEITSVEDLPLVIGYAKGIKLFASLLLS